MNNVLIYFGIGFTVIIASAVAIFAWRVANFFIARRDFYVTSPFDMMMKKLGWCFFWFVFTMYIGVSIIVPKKEKTIDSNQTTTQLK